MFAQRILHGVCSTLVLGTLALSTPAIAGAGPAPKDHGHNHTPKTKVNIGPVAVSGSVSMIMGLDGFAGGNVGVSSGPDGQLIIDDMLSGFSGQLQTELDGLKTCATCGDLKYLINTHWHFDHTGNNEHFGGKAVLIAHDAVRKLLSAPQELKAFNKKIPALNRDGLPDITFTKKSSVYFNGEEIELTHFPASHTSGDIAAFFKTSNVVHMGDVYFNGMFPFIDLEHGGNVKGMIRSVEAALKQYPQDVKIIPGHGALSNMGELKSYLEMLKGTLKVVQTAKAKGMTLAQIQKQGLDKKWHKWAWSFISVETWIKLVYGSL